jgi:hypothetical protein
MTNDKKVTMVLTDDSEADSGVAGGRLAEVHTTAVLPFITLVHVVQRQRGRVRDGEEVAAFLQDLLVLPVGSYLGVLPSNVKAANK